jgi:hypothetical protein
LQGFLAAPEAKGEHLGLSPRRALGYTNPPCGRMRPLFHRFP